VSPAVFLIVSFFPHVLAVSTMPASDYEDAPNSALSSQMEDGSDSCSTTPLLSGKVPPYTATTISEKNILNYYEANSQLRALQAKRSEFHDKLKVNTLPRPCLGTVRTENGFRARTL
jgi:hypothetical protein